MSIQRTGIADGAIQALLLEQVGQAERGDRAFTDAQLAQAKEVAGVLTDFIGAARSSLHMAIYDFRLDGEVADAVVGALNDAAGRGVDVRIAYFQAKGQPAPEAFSALGSDPALVDDGLGGMEGALDAGVRRRAVAPDPGVPHVMSPAEAEAIRAPHNLMHSKYVVRDGLTADAAVLMGSANFTTDAWAVQDNNILVFAPCQALSAYYENDFGEMWQSGRVSDTGNFDTAAVDVGGVPVRVMFAPGRGRQIGAEIAARIDTARDRLIVASMVISSGPILGAIADRMHRVDTFGGIFDGPEMAQVLRQWEAPRANADAGSQAGRRSAASAGKAEQFRQIAAFLHRKDSLPFSERGVHNFMHDKFAVVDDTVITGSFNFSTNAQSNAENVVMVESRALADAYADYYERLAKLYPQTGLRPPER